MADVSCMDLGMKEKMWISETESVIIGWTNAVSVRPGALPSAQPFGLEVLHGQLGRPRRRGDVGGRHPPFHGYEHE